MMNNKKITKPKPRGRPQVSTLKRLTKSVTVKFSKPDYEKLRHRSKNANRTLAEYIRDAAFDARIVAKHSTEDAAVIRNLTGMANNLNQLTRLSHQTAGKTHYKNWFNNCHKYFLSIDALNLFLLIGLFSSLIFNTAKAIFSIMAKFCAALFFFLSSSSPNVTSRCQ